MSSFVAEASVLIRPVADPKAFTAAVESAIAAAQAAAKPVVVPITPVVAGTAGAAGAEIATAAGAATAAQSALAAETTATTAALTAEGTAATQVAAQTEVAAGAALTLAESTTAAGAAAGRAAGQAVGLTKVQNAAAVATQKLALAQAEVVGAASAVAAAQITETRSAAAVAAAETAHNRALQAGNPALIAQTEQTLALAVAQQREALTALEAARAQGARAGQLRQATRGTIAQTASFAGLRAGTLAASAPFIAATASVIVFAKSLQEASDRTEELNKTTVVFGQSAKQIQDFATTTASSLGISEVEALRAAGIFGNLFRSIEIGQRPAAQMSERLVRLASDLSSFNNADPTRVLEALRSGLVGQARPLRVYGIFLSQARAQQEALIETGKKNVKALTNEEIVRARYNLILRDSTLAQGDFERTADRLANQSRTLKANIANLGGELGGILIPVVTSAVGAANDLFGAIEEGNKGIEDIAHGLGQLADIGPIKIPVEIIRKGLGAEDQGPGGAPGFVESFKKALIPASLIVGGLAVAAAPATGGLSLLAAEVAFVTGGLIGAKQITDAYNKAMQQAALQSTHFAAALRGVGVDTKAAETPLLSVITDVQKLVQSLSVQAFPAEGLKALIPHLQAVIAVLRTGPPLAQAFADKLQRIELKLALAANLSPEELRKVLAEVQKELDTFFKGNPLKATAEVQVKTRFSLDTRTAAAAFVGPSAELAQALVNREEGLRNLRNLLHLSPDASRAEIKLAIDAAKFGKDRKAVIERAMKEVTDADRVIEAAARERASSAKDAATKAATAAAQATQAFIDAFEPRTTAIERLIARAGRTEGLGDDLRFNRILLRRLLAERKAIANRIRALHLHGDALKIARDAIKALGESIFNTRQEITRLIDEAAQRRAEALAATLSARQTHLEAMLSIAETTKGVADDRRALNALIAFDKAQIARLTALAKKRKLTREEKAELDAYRVDLAQRNQALRELTDETKKSKSDIQRLHEAEFAFLQTQQGFTASLISNLIPGGLTSGLVGGSQPTTPAGAQVPSVGIVPGRIETVGHQTAAVGPRPVSQGQGNTQIALLREIRNLLRKLNMGIEHPEAKNQRATGSAAMDFSAGKLSMGIGGD